MALVMVSLGDCEIVAVAEVSDFRQIEMLVAGCERGISDDRDMTRGFSVSPRILEYA